MSMALPFPPVGIQFSISRGGEKVIIEVLLFVSSTGEFRRAEGSIRFSKPIGS
jgi:hypothetical protein